MKSNALDVKGGRLYRTHLLAPARSGEHTAPMACGSHHRHRYWAVLIRQGLDAFAVQDRHEDCYRKTIL
jgi:hypothetical protein